MKRTATTDSAADDYFAALLRQDFRAFVERCFQELYPNTSFQANWHIELIAAKCDAVRRGEITRLMINLPPRMLKSLIASVALPAFCLGHAPAMQIMCVSYGQDLCDDFAGQFRKVVSSKWYKKLFPAMRATSRTPSLQEFVTTKNGRRLAVSLHSGRRDVGRISSLLMIR